MLCITLREVEGMSSHWSEAFAGSLVISLPSLSFTTELYLALPPQIRDALAGCFSPLPSPRPKEFALPRESSFSTLPTPSLPASRSVSPSRSASSSSSSSSSSSLSPSYHHDHDHPHHHRRHHRRHYYRHCRHCHHHCPHCHHCHHRQYKHKHKP